MVNVDVALKFDRRSLGAGVIIDRLEVILRVGQVLPSKVKLAQNGDELLDVVADHHVIEEACPTICRHYYVRRLVHALSFIGASIVEVSIEKYLFRLRIEIEHLGGISVRMFELSFTKMTTSASNRLSKLRGTSFARYLLIKDQV
jgi:hypothetical protein